MIILCRSDSRIACELARSIVDLTAGKKREFAKLIVRYLFPDSASSRLVCFSTERFVSDIFFIFLFLFFFLFISISLFTLTFPAPSVHFRRALLRATAAWVFFLDGSFVRPPRIRRLIKIDLKESEFDVC